MSETEPCPLCPNGGQPYFTKTVNGTQMAYVGCSSCGLTLKCAVLGYGENAPLSKDIVTIWNTRPELAKARAEGIAAAIEIVRGTPILSDDVVERMQGGSLSEIQIPFTAAGFKEAAIAALEAAQPQPEEK